MSDEQQETSVQLHSPDAPERGIVELENKRGQKVQYETVASRVLRFRHDHPEYVIETEIVECNDEKVVVIARIGLTYTPADNPQGEIRIVYLSIAHAEEYRWQGDINATSALENCETSAIGRALAFFGYGSANTIASAEEVIGARKKSAKVEALSPGLVAGLQKQAKNGTDALETMWGKLTRDEKQAARSFMPQIKRMAADADASQQKRT